MRLTEENTKENMAEESQAVQEFEETLSELTFNSKHQINMLTMLAKEKQLFAAKIVLAIESHIKQVPVAEKLPALYLVDSIIKNCVDTNYKDLIGRNIVSTFVNVFQKADESTRERMFKLRHTWVGIFPSSRLYAIDVKAKQIDPGWPITTPVKREPREAVKSKETAASRKRSENRQNLEELIPKKKERSSSPSPVLPVLNEDDALRRQEVIPEETGTNSSLPETESEIKEIGIRDTDLRFPSQQQKILEVDESDKNSPTANSSDHPTPSQTFSTMVPLPNPLPPILSAGTIPPRLPAPPPLAPEIHKTDAADRISADSTIVVDDQTYDVKYVQDIALIERNGQPHRIYFAGSPRDVVIDGLVYPFLPFGHTKTVIIDGRCQAMRFGGPGRELYVGSCPIRIAFGGPPVLACIDGKWHEFRLCGSPPEVKIEPEPCYKLIPPPPIMPESDLYRDAPAYFDPPRPQVTPQPGEVHQLNPQLDLNGLLMNLVSAGVIAGSKETPRVEQPSHETDQQNAKKNLQPPPTFLSGQDLKAEKKIIRKTGLPPDMTNFDMDLLTVQYTSVIEDLYENRQKKCPNCGLGFGDTEEHKYRQHLDWHFRENARAKNTSRGASRPWFLAVEDWINFTEQGQYPPNKPKSAIFEKLSAETANRDKVCTVNEVPAVSEEVACCICREAFEVFYDDEEDTWKCKNAIRIDGKVFHPVCYQDETALLT